jgi:hypothetical protein
LKPYLVSNDKKLIALTLVLLSSICDRNEFGQKYLGEKGILKILLELIKNSKDKNLSISMFNLLRILSEYRGNSEYIGNVGMIPYLITLMQSDDERVVYEVSWVIVNLSNSSKKTNEFTPKMEIRNYLQRTRI